MKVMRVVFIGNVLSSKCFLDKLMVMGVEVVGVVTSGKNNFNSDYADLVPLCDKNKLPYLICEDINNEFSLKWISALQPDILFCFGWSQIIRIQLIDLAPKGIVGFHPAALPKNRGRHPIIWALVLGLNETASTFFLIDEGADSGDIISQQVIDIEISDDAYSLYKKIIDTAKKQLEVFVPALQNNSAVYIKQDIKLANYWRRRHCSDGVIDWRMSSISIYNLVRALTYPYVGAEFEYNRNIYKVWKVSIIKDRVWDNIEYGKVVDIIDGACVVKCADYCIKLEHVVPYLMISVGEYL